MKTILKDVISCNTLRAKVKAIFASILIAILERIIDALQPIVGAGDLDGPCRRSRLLKSVATGDTSIVNCQLSIVH